MSIHQTIQARKVLEHIQPYSPGKPVWEVQEELGLDQIIKVASNENPLGPSPKALEAILVSLTGINRYPDANATDLKRKIAIRSNLLPEQIIVTNGADELITLISETFLNLDDEIIVPSPSFSEYDFGAYLMGAKVVGVPLVEHYQYNVESILSAVTQRTKIVYLCSPNNPTGTYLSKKHLHILLDSLPKHVLVVFDGAYSHYATADDYTDGIEYVKLGYPIIVLQTFSKIYGLAGVRIGFGLAPEAIVQNILKVKEPFNVNTLAQAAATAAINDDKHVEASQGANTLGRLQLYEGFSKLGLSYTESMSNFVLVRVGPKAKDVYEELLSKGIIVRYGDTWGLEEYIRISVGKPKENDTLLKAMASVLQETC
ncbi:histidinol-phosphate transaminase [Priestia megaterium]|uniref:histidinol-phosphate transaminase n=1 Tax=Priestia megaterium TaxID=1404 RepID=UPI0039DFCB3F